MDFIEFGMTWMPFLLEGVGVTLGLWAVAMVLGFCLALLLVWGRVYGSKPIYLVATTYVEVFRGTPMLVQLFFIYLGLPEIGIVLDPFSAAALAIGLNTAAYQAEYFRGAIQSLPSGQMVAARAMGMSRFQALRDIILPQAGRRVIPQWSNEAVVELKYTSIAYAIGLTELTARAEQVGYQTFQFLEAFTLVAIIYLVLTGIVAQSLDLLERKTRIPGLTYTGGKME
ncbi:amino acid ABC transporter permease [Litchfieldella qijiaojingensis]|uniref:Amino acid ABC transporter permease n=1 Tax=Litchfieldella qijiaojingensis TaxID=980347 RepID=A0ABQ2ZBM3_9GAMM|nr:amino acid ABC transporter permease [Halomonas qijiaojingensis]GGY09632.1 amino acid ABC transporter permease [Halomonas qijiaojingensis]